MHQKNRNLLVFLLSILLLLSGFCPDSLQVHASFYHAPAKESSCLGSIQTNSADAQVCTPEMLGIHSARNLPGSIHRNTHSKKECKTFLDFLCPDCYFITKGIFFSNTGFQPVCSQVSKEQITKYIHNSDGKKRL